MYYGADYYPEHWPEGRWAEDARLMQEAGINLVRMGEFAWTKMERREAEYSFDWLDRAIALLAEHGIETVLGTPTATPPAWLMHAYPECFLVDKHGQRLTFGHRRNTCPNHPTYRTYSARIVTALAQHYGGHPHVIGWQIDNEFGDRCYCQVCQRRFQEWLRSRYGSLDALNDAWGTVFWSHIYTAWEEIPLPWATSYTSSPSLALNYRRFMSDSYVDYQRTQIEILRRLSPDRFITHNLMGFRYPKLDYFDLVTDLDFVSWDNYPRYRGAPDLATRALAHDTMRGLKRRSFWVMEAQSGPAGQLEVSSTPRPGEIPFWAWQALAHGADGIVYFRWRTCRFGAEEYWHGILDHDGLPRRRYREVAAMGAALQGMGDGFLDGRVVAPAAIMLSYDSRFAFQGQPNNPELRYEGILTNYYRSLWRRNIGVDVVSPAGDLAGYALVIAPVLYVLDEDTAQRLEAYVGSGGALLITCRSGVMDRDNVVVNQPLPGLLAELCGVHVKEYDSCAPEDAVALVTGEELGGKAYTARTWVDVLAPTDGLAVLARYGADYYAGEAAVTARRYGQGMVIYVGTLPDQAFVDQLMGWICQQRDIYPPLDAPAEVEVTLRQSDHARYLFLLNGASEPRVVDVGEGGVDLIGGEAISGEVTIEPLGVVIVRQNNPNH